VGYVGWPSEREEFICVWKLGTRRR